MSKGNDQFKANTFLIKTDIYDYTKLHPCKPHRVGSRQKELTTAFCYFCAKPVPEVLEIKNGKKFARKVVFCNSACFGRYLAANRPIIRIPHNSPLDIACRAAERLAELRADVLFHPQEDTQCLIDEEIMFELHYIIEGREEVTKGDRYECLPNVRAAQPAARLRV